MDLAVTIIFHLFAFIFFVFALYEERDTKNSDEEEEKSDHLCILLLLFSVICFWIAGVTMFSVTETYYSVTTDALETVFMAEYRPLGWFGCIVGTFIIYLLVVKVLETLGYHSEE